MAVRIVAPEDVGRAVTIEVPDAGYLVIDARTPDVVPDETAIVHLPGSDVTCRIVAPEQVRAAVAVEVADAGHLVIDPGASEVVPGLDAVLHLPASDMPGRIVAPEHVRYRVGIEVSRSRIQIVVLDDSDALTVADGDAAGRPRQIDEESFVYFEPGVAVDGDRDRLAIDAGPEMQRAGGRDVVVVGGSGAAVGGGEVDVERHRTA